MSMMSAAEFLEEELSGKEKKLPWRERLEPRHKQSQWVADDYMDFSERYADYVVGFEKYVDRTPAWAK